MEQLPLEDIFGGKEHGETGSLTMDLAFAILDSLFILLTEIEIFRTFRERMMRQLIDLLVVRIVNVLLLNAEFCTLSSGFRLKIVISMLNLWCNTQCGDNNNVVPSSFDILNETATLLLTCASASDSKWILSTCRQLNVVQINYLLQNYNAAVTNEIKVDKDKVLSPISLKALRQSGTQRKGSVPVLKFVMEGIEWKNEGPELHLPKITFADVDVPFELLDQPVFAFLQSNDGLIL